MILSFGGKMKAKQIKRLIKIVNDSQISELEISGWGKHICIRKDIPQKIIQ